MKCAVFPGQGAQHVGMSKDLLENFSVAREAFEEASEAVKLNLKKLCLDGPESDLNLTENTQPCLLVSSVAAFRVAEKEHGFKPDAVAGHSLGEYSALVAAGAFSLASATQWVKIRGRAMQEAVPAGKGGMAALLNLEDPQVESLCQKAATQSGQVVSPANYNSPGQVVIAGETAALQVVAELVKSDDDFKSGKFLPLKVSAPFHCSLMRPARDRMAEVFQSAQTPKLGCPYIPNRTARLTQEPTVIFELLVEQVDHPVLWKQSVETLLNKGFLRAYEFGPGKVLQGLIKRSCKTLGKNIEVQSIGDSAGIQAWA